MNRNAIIGAVILIALMAIWYLYWDRPMARERRSLRAQIQVEQTKLATYQEALARFKDQINEYQKTRSEAGKPVVPFSAESRIIGLYETLDSLCHKPGFRLDEITPSLEETVRFFRQWASTDSTLSMPIRIKIKSDYRSLANLVATVEKLPDFAGMDDCRIDASDQLYPDCALDMTFTAALGNRMEFLGLE